MGRTRKEVRYWGEWVLKKVKAEIGDLYPLIPDPTIQGKERARESIASESTEEFRPAFLCRSPISGHAPSPAKKPNCKATVPLLKQSWLCKKKDRYVALKMIAPKREEGKHLK